MSETWMPVIGYEGFYEVSDLGQVRTVSRRVPTRGVNKTRQVNTRLLKPYADRWGYLRVSLSRGDNKAKSLKVHRLVAHAFIGAPSLERPFVLHWNDVQTDNRRENLRYGNRRDNIADGIRNGILPDWRTSPPPWVGGAHG